jgi:hypothetical protein
MRSPAAALEGGGRWFVEQVSVEKMVGQNDEQEGLIRCFDGDGLGLAGKRSTTREGPGRQKLVVAKVKKETEERFDRDKKLLQALEILLWLRVACTRDM